MADGLLHPYVVGHGLSAERFLTRVVGRLDTGKEFAMRALLWGGGLLLALALVTWFVFEATAWYALALVAAGAIMLLWGIVVLFRAS